MARILDIDSAKDEIRTKLSKSFQSGNLNFLLGSGASLPAIPLAGPIEEEIAALFEAGNEGDARKKMCDFIWSVQAPMNNLIAGTADVDNETVLAEYDRYFRIVEAILSERRSTLLPRQTNIFTTNYDLFIEKACSRFPGLILNDGFIRTPNLTGRTSYSSRNFFNSTYNTGNSYTYKVEVPCINLIKLHGSISWKRDPNDLLFYIGTVSALSTTATDADRSLFLEKFAVVLPQVSKFRTTVMDRNYYELLRIYANQLDRENTVVLAFGFSFDDMHLVEITQRGLKNSTLRLVVFAYDNAARDSLAARFDGYNNVEIISTASPNKITFSKFNEILRDVLPESARPG